MSSSTDDLGAAARRSVRWTSVNAIGTVALQMLQVVVLARLLEPEDFGQMAILLVMLTICSNFSELGLSSAIIHKSVTRRSDLATLYVLNLLAGVVIALFLWIAAPWISAFFNLGPMTALIRGVAVSFLISPWGLQCQVLMQKRLEFASLAALNLTSLAIGTLGAIALAFAGFGVWSLIGGYLVQRIVSAAGSVAVAIRKELWSGFAWDLAGARSYLAFGGFRLAATAVNGINTRMDQLVIGTLMGAGPLGLYNVAQRLALEPVQRIVPIVSRVALPLFSLAQDQPARLRRGYMRMNGLLLGITAPLLLGLAATAHVVVPVLLGPKWDAGIQLVRVSALYSVLRSIGSAAGPLLLAKGRADWSLYWDAGKLVVVPVAIWLSMQWSNSILAVAWALVLLQVVLLIAHYFFLLRNLIGNCGVEHLMTIARPMLTAAAMAWLVWTLDSLLTELPLILRLLVLPLAGAIAYVAFSLAVQRQLMNELLDLVGARRWAFAAHHKA